MKDINNYRLTGTKAETLKKLEDLDYNIPKVYFFSVDDWNNNSTEIINIIISEFKDVKLAIRSSTKAEDNEDSSMAGAFKSLLNVVCESKSIESAVKEVISSFDSDITNQILVQPMVVNVAMSGVVMSHVLDDGSPYHVINFDDKTGLTDTVTSGSTINKTIYIYNGVDEKDFDSQYLKVVLDLVRNLQKTFANIPIDIEFAVDKNHTVFLLQVRKITTIGKWNKEVNEQVSSRMLFLKEYVGTLMKRRPNLFGNRTLLGFMPDWNPAEMIGVVPHPLSMSLYRELITKSTWRIARERMGYKVMPNIDLMVSLFGRVYIDVRASINSFLPKGTENSVAEKLVNAYIERLDKNPQLHDKLEFDVVQTAFDFSFDDTFKERYPSLLTESEYKTYKNDLKKITIDAIKLGENSSLKSALESIEFLKLNQLKNKRHIDFNSFAIADEINNLVNECIKYGTLPFSILARHGFIAESLLRSAVKKEVLTEERLKDFRRSTVTIAGEMSRDFNSVLSNELTQKVYIDKYGHLRPSSYDILSPNYANRKDLFDGQTIREHHSMAPFKLTKEENEGINNLFYENDISSVNASKLMLYAEESIKGREYAKFIFTKHLSSILELVAKWGEIKGFTRNQVSMLTINEILDILVSPLTKDVKPYFERKIEKAEENFKIASSFKLSYLIRSTRDVHIVPMQRSSPNFIGSQRIEGEVVELTPYLEDIPNLKGKIVCIEGADPGYDWIFTRNIAGLITKYGGANSHMAIRCAEYNLPAAIGCGEQPFERVVSSTKCLLDCQGKRLEPIELNEDAL
ncbi:PEP/pyruvate-binding domain-containing protein [Flavobacteriales bacterium]|nr:PEP/pyruvate-binding domain-containing protein [Flavobacteriales bacterium]